jgi:hypothetical protein
MLVFKAHRQAFPGVRPLLRKIALLSGAVGLAVVSFFSACAILVGIYEVVGKISPKTEGVHPASSDPNVARSAPSPEHPGTLFDKIPPEQFGRRWRTGTRAQRGQLLEYTTSKFLGKCLADKNVDEVTAYLGKPDTDAPTGELRVFSYAYSTGELVIFFNPDGTLRVCFCDE